MNNNVKILIFGQSFDTFSGGGITLSNLFTGLPQKDIAVICLPFYLQNHDTNICNNYYQIGQEEYHWKFPFNLYKQTYPSGIIIKPDKDFGSVNQIKPKFKEFISNNLVNPFIKWLGLTHCISSIHISPRMKKWISEFKPDILYIQITGQERESILFSLSLIDYLKIPSVIHMMDDWPETICSKGLLKNYWKKKILNEFKQLLDKVNLHLSISNAMSEEYFKRYQKCFKPFHNPVDIKKYNIIKKKKKPAKENIYRILYLGRIGIANKNSIYEFANFISQYRFKQYSFEMDIFTSDIYISDLHLINKLNKIKVKPPVSNGEVPSLLKEYDLLLLPLDFSIKGLKYAKFSIPTKTSEYMLSGTPILVFAPGETAVSKFFSENECGCCVTESSREKLEQALRIIISNDKLITKMSSNAVRYAKEKFDADKVRKEFQNMLRNASTISMDNK